MRDQASDDEKCLTFADRFAGSAKNWYRQLSRSTRNKWSDLIRSFHIQYIGLGTSVANQYYHTRCWTTCIGSTWRDSRLKIKDGCAKDRRKNVYHYIETLACQDLEERVTLLRLTDADDLEEVFRARDRSKNHQKEAAF
ncbi:LOW QUALITY PROTEIN: hypothetical protein PHMEG_0008501 [Phytophthora megakarya]|uniref:Retrotransposon gag domain-containing protein n=1 Tax=Phytophthora megakarya TaxID=4795 RepID=A0A225WKA2_9STRA|nr:LOW QUALITY PROTEIN: hypothetical protein PHMEG_0008501 [Phytophthora megakarya]